MTPEAIPSSPRLDGGGAAAAFGRTPEPIIPSPVDWLVVAIAKRDRVRVIYDAPPTADRSGAEFGEADKGGSSVFTHRDHNHDELGTLVQSLRKAIADIDYFQSGERKYDSFEFKCKGTPWLATGLRTVKANLLILRLAETLDRFG